VGDSVNENGAAAAEPAYVGTFEWTDAHGEDGSVDIHAAAADAYEGFLRFYPKYDQIAHVQLMLGLLYARYLNQPVKARDNLNAALQRLSAQREIDIAKEELAKLGGPVTS